MIAPIGHFRVFLDRVVIELPILRAIRKRLSLMEENRDVLIFEERFLVIIMAAFRFSFDKYKKQKWEKRLNTNLTSETYGPYRKIQENRPDLR